MKALALLVVAGACSKAESPKDNGPGVAPSAPEIKVALAGVTLAEDCADGVPTKPLAPPAAPTTTASAGSGYQSPSASMPAAKVAAESIAAGACAGPNCGSIPQPACEQTAMQIAVQVPSGATATRIKIKTVELLDEAGKVAGTLTARAPSKWNGNAYVAWDESVGKTDFVVSYKLTSPDWNKLTNGRWNAPTKKFSLRVTVAIDDKDKTIEKQSIVPAMPEPAVAT